MGLLGASLSFFIMMSVYLVEVYLLILLQEK